MEGVWISALGPESQKWCHLSGKPLHFCLENSQFQISLKNQDFQICSPCRRVIPVSGWVHCAEGKIIMILFLSPELMSFLYNICVEYTESWIQGDGHASSPQIQLKNIFHLNVCFSHRNKLWPWESSSKTLPLRRILAITLLLGHFLFGPPPHPERGKKTPVWSGLRPKPPCHSKAGLLVSFSTGFPWYILTDHFS